MAKKYFFLLASRLHT